MEMGEVLRDPLWQTIGVLFGALSFILLVLYRRQDKKNNRPKALKIEIVAATSLVNFTNEVDGKLQLFFDSIPVKEVSLLIVKMENTGSKAILPSDFFTPITFLFENHSQILEAEVTRVSPPELEVKMKANEKEIIFSPTLLNPEDYVIVKLLVSDYHSNFKVSGRVVDVQTIQIEHKYEEETRKEWWDRYDEIVYLFIGLAISLLSEVLANRFSSFFVLIIGFVFLVSAIIYVSIKWWSLGKSDVDI